MLLMKIYIYHSYQPSQLFGSAREVYLLHAYIYEIQ